MGIVNTKRPVGTKKQKELDKKQKFDLNYQCECLDEKKKMNEALLSIAKHNAEMSQVYAESVNTQKVQAQIQSLIAMGNHDQAQAVMSKWLNGESGGDAPIVNETTTVQNEVVGDHDDAHNLD